MRSVADLLRAEERAALATVTPGERVALAVALGARDLEAFRLAHEPPLEPAEAARVLERRAPSEIEGVSVPVATAADLVLLKLYAGGPQDAWDVEQLLAGPGRAALVAEVDAALGTLPEDTRRLWARIVRPH